MKTNISTISDSVNKKIQLQEKGKQITQAASKQAAKNSENIARSNEGKDAQEREKFVKEAERKTAPVANAALTAYAFVKYHSAVIEFEHDMAKAVKTDINANKIVDGVETAKGNNVTPTSMLQPEQQSVPQPTLSVTPSPATADAPQSTSANVNVISEARADIVNGQNINIVENVADNTVLTPQPIPPAPATNNTPQPIPPVPATNNTPQPTRINVNVISEARADIVNGQKTNISFNLSGEQSVSPNLTATGIKTNATTDVVPPKPQIIKAENAGKLNANNINEAVKAGDTGFIKTAPKPQRPKTPKPEIDVVSLDDIKGLEDKLKIKGPGVNAEKIITKRDYALYMMNAQTGMKLKDQGGDMFEDLHFSLKGKVDAGVYQETLGNGKDLFDEKSLKKLQFNTTNIDGQAKAISQTIKQYKGLLKEKNKTLFNELTDTIKKYDKGLLSQEDAIEKLKVLLENNPKTKDVESIISEFKDILEKGANDYQIKLFFKDHLKLKKDHVMSSIGGQMKDIEKFKKMQKKRLKKTPKSLFKMLTSDIMKTEGGQGLSMMRTVYSPMIAVGRFAANQTGKITFKVAEKVAIKSYASLIRMDTVRSSISKKAAMELAREHIRKNVFVGNGWKNMFKEHIRKGIITKTDVLSKSEKFGGRVAGTINKMAKITQENVGLTGSVSKARNKILKEAIKSGLRQTKAGAVTSNLLNRGTAPIKAVGKKIASSKGGKLASKVFGKAGNFARQINPFTLKRRIQEALKKQLKKLMGKIGSAIAKSLLGQLIGPIITAIGSIFSSIVACLTSLIAPVLCIMLFIFFLTMVPNIVEFMPKWWAYRTAQYQFEQEMKVLNNSHNEFVTEIQNVMKNYTVADVIFEDGKQENYREILSALEIMYNMEQDWYDDQDSLQYNNILRTLYVKSHFYDVEEYEFTELDGTVKKGAHINVRIQREEALVNEAMSGLSTGTLTDGNGNPVYSGNCPAATVEDPNNNWLGVVKAVKNAIASTSPTYSQSASRPIEINGVRKNVRDDCSGFVSACCQYYGALNETWSSHAFTGASELSGFTKYTFSGWDNLCMGDIISYPGHVEIFAYNANGKHYVWSNGSTDGMRRTYDNPGSDKRSYVTVWRPNISTGEGPLIPDSSTSDFTEEAVEDSLGGDFGWDESALEWEVPFTNMPALNETTGNEDNYEWTLISQLGAEASEDAETIFTNEAYDDTNRSHALIHNANNWNEFNQELDYSYQIEEGKKVSSGDFVRTMYAQHGVQYTALALDNIINNEQIGITNLQPGDLVYYRPSVFKTVSYKEWKGNFDSDGDGIDDRDINKDGIITESDLITAEAYTTYWAPKLLKAASWEVSSIEKDENYKKAKKAYEESLKNKGKTNTAGKRPGQGTNGTSATTSSNTTGTTSGGHKVEETDVSDDIVSAEVALNADSVLSIDDILYARDMLTTNPALCNFSDKTLIDMVQKYYIPMIYIGKNTQGRRTFIAYSRDLHRTVENGNLEDFLETEAKVRIYTQDELRQTQGNFSAFIHFKGFTKNRIYGANGCFAGWTDMAVSKFHILANREFWATGLVDSVDDDGKPTKRPFYDKWHEGTFDGLFPEAYKDDGKNGVWWMSGENTSANYDHKHQFEKQMAIWIRNNWDNYRVLSSTIMSDAMLTSNIRTTEESIKLYNIFGVKDGASTGTVNKHLYPMGTTMYTNNETFAAYNSIEEALIEKVSGVSNKIINSKYSNTTEFENALLNKGAYGADEIARIRGWNDYSYYIKEYDTPLLERQAAIDKMTELSESDRNKNSNIKVLEKIEDVTDHYQYTNADIDTLKTWKTNLENSKKDYYDAVKGLDIVEADNVTVNSMADTKKALADKVQGYVDRINAALKVIEDKNYRPLDELEQNMEDALSDALSSYNSLCKEMSYWGYDAEGYKTLVESSGCKEENYGFTKTNADAFYSWTGELDSDITDFKTQYTPYKSLLSAEKQKEFDDKIKTYENLSKVAKNLYKRLKNDYITASATIIIETQLKNKDGKLESWKYEFQNSVDSNGKAKYTTYKKVGKTWSKKGGTQYWKPSGNKTYHGLLFGTAKTVNPSGKKYFSFINNSGVRETIKGQIKLATSGKNKNIYITDVKW